MTDFVYPMQQVAGQADCILASCNEDCLQVCSQSPAQADLQGTTQEEKALAQTLCSSALS